MIIQVLQKVCTVFACSGIFWGYYWLALRHKSFHNWNRFYLITSVMLSLAIPFIRFNIGSAALQQLQNFPLLPLAQTNQFEHESPLQQAAGNWDWQSLLGIIYWTVASILAIGFAAGIAKLLRLKFTSPTFVAHKTKLHLVEAESAPFSFFHWIFWKKDLPLTTAEGRQILRHELAHVRQWHSIDRTIMETVTIFCWWNPFFWLAKKEIAAVQEFLADRQACPKNEVAEYSMLLLSNIFQTQFSLLTNPFFHSNIKRRLIMLTNQKKSKNQFLTRLAVIPTALAVVALFSFKVKKTDHHLPESNKPITIVVDASHGGIDDGAISANGVKEKDIALALVQKIKAQAADRNITVVLTREGDELPVPGDKNASLKKRVEMTKANNTTLFLSVHVGASTEKSMSGFQVYVQNKNDNRLAESRQLGSLLLHELAPLHKTADKEILQRNTENIYVLEANSVPSILLEAGFISNADDLAYITNAANQDKIATAILNGVVKYSNR